MIKLMFSGISKFVLIAVKGFSKILLHQNLDEENEIEYLTFMLLLWMDQNLRKNEQHEALQTITCFIQHYISLSPKKADLFIKAMLRIITIFVVDGNLQNPFVDTKIDWFQSTDEPINKRSAPDLGDLRNFLFSCLVLIVYAKNKMLNHDKE